MCSNNCNTWKHVLQLFYVYTHTRTLSLSPPSLSSSPPSLSSSPPPLSLSLSLSSSPSISQVDHIVGDLWIELYSASFMRQQLLGQTTVPLYSVRHSNKVSGQRFNYHNSTSNATWWCLDSLLVKDLGDMWLG